MKLIDLTCPHCSANLKVDDEQKKATCEHCGATILIDDEVRHIQYDNAEEAGYKFEKGRQRAKEEAIRKAQTPYPEPIKEQPKKRKTWLWVLGWICIFPLPLTILMLRKKEMKPALKYGIIAISWILYFAIAALGNSDKVSSDSTPVNQTATEQKQENTKLSSNDQTTLDFEEKKANVAASQETEAITPVKYDDLQNVFLLL